MPTIEIEPIKPLIGGIVHVERSALFDEAVVQRCLEALEDRGVLVFPRVESHAMRSSSLSPMPSARA